MIQFSALTLWAERQRAILERGSVLDVAAAQGPAAEITRGTPEEQLRNAVAACGCRVVDFRGWGRTKLYGKEYGSFRDKGDADGDGNTKEYGRFPPLRGAAVGRIKIEKLSTLVIHTADVVMPHRRFLGTPCTIGISDDDCVVLCHSVLARIAHAHTANPFSGGLEISGKDGAATEIQIKLARLAVRYWFDEVSRLRASAEEQGRRMVASRLCVAPHRLYHDTRREDPGPRIWSHVGEWAKRDLGMGEAPCPTRYPKRMIPHDWRTVA